MGAIINGTASSAGLSSGSTDDVAGTEVAAVVKDLVNTVRSLIPKRTRRVCPEYLLCRDFVEAASRVASVFGFAHDNAV